jgi:hypothetical protein
MLSVYSKPISGTSALRPNALFLYNQANINLLFQPIAKNALTILVNLSSHDEEIRANLAQDDDLLIDLVRKVTVLFLDPTQTTSLTLPEPQRPQPTTPRRTPRQPLRPPLAIPSPHPHPPRHLHLQIRHRPKPAPRPLRLHAQRHQLRLPQLPPGLPLRHLRSHPQILPPPPTLRLRHAPLQNLRLHRPRLRDPPPRRRQHPEERLLRNQLAPGPAVPAHGRRTSRDRYPPLHPAAARGQRELPGRRDG